MRHAHGSVSVFICLLLELDTLLAAPLQVCLKELVARLNKSYDSEHDLQALKVTTKPCPNRSPLPT